ncbi:MAG: outer membrane lipoprotein-sorting protein [Flavobacteriales bacterium]|nr:outer membrane lipoprotein-sorting protein [Flavobacteriales bacterium]
MKKTLLIFAVFSASLRAQTAEEVVKFYSNALGGADAWKKVESLSFKGKVEVQGMTFPVVIHSKRPNFFYQEMEFMGKKIKQVFAGDRGWTINPFTGSDKPQPMSPEQAKEMKHNASFDDALMFFEENGSTIKLLDPAKLDGLDTYVVELTEKDGTITRYFIDKELGLPLKEISIREGEEVEKIFSDFRQVDSKILPFKMEYKVKGNVVSVLQFEQVEFNNVKDDSLFRMPE